LFFFNSPNNDPTSSISPYVSLDKQRLYYMNVQGLIKKANQVACKTCDEDFITLLTEYINNKNHEASDATFNLDQENIGKIGNPIVRCPKGRPPGTKRFKRPLEDSSNSNEIAGRNHQNKCGLCNNIGHNRTTCSSNPNRKKRIS
jgi:hypothetical protein